MMVELPLPPRGLHPNSRLHYQALARLKKAYKHDCWALTKEAGAKAPTEGRIRLHIEWWPRTANAYDQDGAIASMKAGLDGIALALGVDDSRFDLAPVFHMEPVKGGRVAVRLEALA